MSSYCSSEDGAKLFSSKLGGGCSRPQLSFRRASRLGGERKHPCRSNPHTDSSPLRPQKIATAFGGLATPPGTYLNISKTPISTKRERNINSRTLSGILLKKKVHLPSLPHNSLSPSKSNISPIGIPHPANNHSCNTYLLSTCGPTGGLLSNDGPSPATAAN
jgi:hypothetical protein